MLAQDTTLHSATEQIDAVRAQIQRVIVGHERVVDGVLNALLSGGHVLLEGVPGLGKTTLLRTLGHALHLDYSRIQFTPDLMPADILGSVVMDTNELGAKALRFEKGPVFAHLVLADEINRATPRTQSALLEAMQEKTVTSGTTTHLLDEPFLVMATQNPLEMEGTYPLPEAQLDRFLLKLLVEYPEREDLTAIVDRTADTTPLEVDAILDRDQILQLRRAASQTLVAPHVRDYAISLVLATQPRPGRENALARKYVRYGSSPRGAQALVLCGRVRALMQGRLHVSTEDVRELALSALRHRIILNFDAHADGRTEDDLLLEMLESLPEPTTP
ncbi:MAG: MoxR family ATPase [Acidobacteriia bacterium]|nr:MoxR family ATPase [Terriglobia bacterium]MYG04277.1 MoxR family ATPase [Terriglobia bacterium]MYK09244.1 MoxR family ATPase [Terriglobia bacterium]